MMPRMRTFVSLFLFASTALAADVHGLDLPSMDKSIAPGNDFDAYANGTWEKTTVIPADRSSWGAFYQLRELADKRTAALIADTAKAAAPSPNAATADAKKVGDFYAAFMDEATIEQRNLTALKEPLGRIAAVHDPKSLARLLGQSLRADVDPLNNTNFATENLFGLWVAPGFAEAHHYVPYLLQGGLGLPDRDYYVSTVPKMVELKQKYFEHVVAVLKLVGVADPVAGARRVLALETQLAEAHATREESEDVLKANNLWSRENFDQKAPGLDWAAFFDGAGLAAQKSFYVWQAGAISKEAALVKSAPLESWKAWLTFHLVNQLAGAMPKRFADEDFAFYGHTLSGTPLEQDRWKRGVRAVNAAMGDAVGALYAARHFPAESKARARAMVTEIVAAFGKRVDKLSWMSPATRARAKAKLATLYVGIGYPDRWRDYGKLEVARNDALGNLVRARDFEYRYRLSQLGHDVDKSEWAMTPQTVNAVNLPLQNALNFPAAILEPPFFDAQADDAVNYGAMGSVIGHEISHSFDDQGAMFDADGKLANWWTPEDLAHFKAAAARLVAQYSAYKPFPDLAVNGQVTLSENLADVAGLSAALDGWKASLGGKPAPSAQGVSGLERFFLGFAQAHRTVIREAALRKQVATDGHAPGKYRTQTVRNLDEWYEAFHVQPGKALFLAPPDRVRIW
jgi:putative endopeptidase